MSFTSNASNLTGKSTTNAFNIVADNITVEKNELIKGDLTVIGNTNIGNVTLQNGSVNNLTVNNLTVTTPIPVSSGGTGLSTLGSPTSVLAVNLAGTALTYQAAGLLSNPSYITGYGYTGTPTFNFGIESAGGGNGRGFIRTSAAATELVLGTTTSDVIKLSGASGTGNFTYNSSGSSGVFQVTNAGGAITFTNSGTGTISMATAGGSITLADPTAAAAVQIGTAGGIFNLSTGIGALNITTALGTMNIGTGGGPLNIATGIGNLSITATTGILSLTTASAGAVNLGATVGAVNLYGSVLTVGSAAVALASGAFTGTTGLWSITTGAFGLTALGIVNISSTASITLASGVGNIILNGVATTSNGNFSATGNIYSPQNINWGSLAINNNTTLTVTSPKSILVRGGSGVTITLPNATTLTTGWNYIVNNNSGQTVTVNDASAGLVATVLASQLCNLFLLTNPNAAGTWDSHISGPTNSFTGIVSITASNSSGVSGVLNVSNTFTTSATLATFLQPNLTTGNSNYIQLGKNASTNNCIYMSYNYNSTASATSYNMYFSGQATPDFKITNNASSGVSFNLTGNTVITGTTNSVTVLDVTAPSAIANGRVLFSVTSPDLPNSGGEIYQCIGRDTSHGCLMSYYWNINLDLTKFKMSMSNGFVFLQAQTAALSVDLTLNAALYNLNCTKMVTTATPTTSATVASFLLPNAVTSGNSSSILLGQDDSTNRSMYISYVYNTTASLSTANIGFNGGSAILSLAAVGNATFSGSASSSQTGVLNVTNSTTSNSTILTCLTPNLGTGNFTSFILGKSASTASGTGQSAEFKFYSNGASSYLYWGFWGGSPANNITLNGDGSTNLVATNTNVYSSSTTFTNFYYNFVFKGNITYNTSTGLVQYNQSSDYRLKTNVKPISDALLKMTQLRPVTYNWIENNTPSFGFLAHEVENIIPVVTGKKDAVDENGKPIYQKIDYSNFTPYTVAAIKDLYAIIQTLQNRITVLESQ